MKQVLKITAFKKAFQQFIVATVLCLAILSPEKLWAQADSTETDSTQAEEPAVEEESSLISPAVLFTSTQKGDNTIDLKAALKAKVKGSTIKLTLLKVTFLQITDSAEKVLGFVITDRNGVAVLNTKAGLLQPNKEGKLHFKAVFAGNKAMEPVEEEITIKRARLEIIPIKDDSLLTVQVKLIDLLEEQETPVPETLIGIFVKRLFNPLKVGEGTTDETGAASIEIPKNLPGDIQGKITLLAKLDESDLYGNMESSIVQQWGIPVSGELRALPRGLWGSDPPQWMLVTFIILMTVVWGHYIVIIYELFRLRKEEPRLSAKVIK